MGSQRASRGQIIPVAQITSAPAIITEVSVISALWRQRQDLKRAAHRLTSQSQAMVRRYSDTTRDAQRRWKAILAGESDELLPVIRPYLTSLEPLELEVAVLDQGLRRRVRKLPVWALWAREISGLGDLNIAGLLGEAGRPLFEYDTVSALWKRMGLAVVNGECQKLRRGPENEPLRRGYSPRRRAYAYTLAASLMRAQRNPGETYRAIYEDRKLYELARGISPGWANNRAGRVMVKAMLRDAWVADRRFLGVTA